MSHFNAELPAPVPSTGVLLYRAGLGAPVRYGTIAAAMSAAVAGDVVFVGSGTYTENPVVPDDVIVKGATAPRPVIIAGSGGANTRVTLGANATIRDVMILGPSDDGAAAIEFAGASGQSAIVIDVSLVGTGGAGAAVRNTGAGRLLARDLNVLGGTFTQLVDLSDGAVVLESANVLAGNVGRVFDVSGGANLDARNVTVSTTGTVTDGLRIQGAGSTAFLTAVTFKGQPTNAVNIQGDGIVLDAKACDLRGGTYDLLVNSGLVGESSEVNWNACVSRLERWSVPDAWFQGARFTAIFEDPGDNEDRTIRILGELSVGSAANPREATFGEGDSNTINMHVLSYDGSTYTDNTAAAKTAAGSTFAFFSALAPGTATYMGNTTRKFYGFKMDLTIAGDWADPEYLVWEYWSDTATAWQSFNIMETQGIDSGALDAFKRNSHIYFDDRFLNDWVQTTINGIAAYWVRVRVATAIIQSPTLERTKLHTNRMEANETGGVQFYGAAEPVRVFATITPEMLSVPSGGANSPNAFNLAISANISYRQNNAAFPSGSDVRRAGTMIPAPEGLDTSKQVTCTVIFTTDGTDANPVQWNLYVAQVRAGDVIGVLAQQTISNTEAPTGTAVSGKVWEVDFNVDVPRLKPGDFISFMLWRLGATDSNSDTANVMALKWSGRFWLA